MTTARNIQRTPTGNDPSKQVKNKNTIKFNAQRFVTKQVGKLLEEYAIGDMLGSGGFGEVYLGKHKKTGAERAIKVVNKSSFDDGVNEAVLHEFNVVRKLDRKLMCSPSLCVWDNGKVVNLLFCSLSRYIISYLCLLSFLNF